MVHNRFSELADRVEEEEEDDDDDDDDEWLEELDLLGWTAPAVSPLIAGFPS